MDKDLITMLVCTVCKKQLETCPAGDGLLCGKCQLVFPVLDEIPVMLTDEAVPVETWQGSLPSKPSQ